MKDGRLDAALPYVRSGARVVDVGTDHAYLPIALIQSGIASAVLATDVAKGPIETARANISSAGLSDKIGTLQTDGLSGVDWFCPTDITIFGMGGELIAKILSDYQNRREDLSGLRFVLQPMSRASFLRAWLWDNGFSIVGETIADEGRCYEIICAEYTGKREPYTQAEAILGKVNLADRPPLFCHLLEKEIRRQEKKPDGKILLETLKSFRREP